MASCSQHIIESEGNPIPVQSIVSQHGTFHRVADLRDFSSRYTDIVERNSWLLVLVGCQFRVDEWLKYQVPGIDSANYRKLRFRNPIMKGIRLFAGAEQCFAVSSSYFQRTCGWIDVPYTRTLNASMRIDRC